MYSYIEFQKYEFTIFGKWSGLKEDQTIPIL